MWKLWLFILLCNSSVVTVVAMAAVSGQLKTVVDYYPHSIYEPVDNVIPTLQGQLQGKKKWRKYLRGQWKLVGSTNFVSDGDGKTYPGRTETFYADLQEAFVEAKSGQQKIRGGFNTVNWGVVDLYSPMDVVNTSALFHPLRSQRQGAGMLQWGWSGDSFEMDALYIPWQTAPLLPDTDSRWLPRSFLVNVGSQYGRVYIPEKLEYRSLKPVTLDGALQHSYGAKITSRFGSLDMHAMYYEGTGTTAKTVPTIGVSTVNGQLVADSPIYLAPLYYKMRTSGLSFVYAGEKWIFKNENVYQSAVTKHPLVQSWNWQHVLAAETNWDIGSRTLTTIFQYYYSNNPVAADNLMSNYFRIFDSTPVLALRLPYSDDITLTGSVLYESKSKGYFMLAGFEQKLKDELSWGLAWRDFSAQRDGILKTYDKNDHVAMDLTYYF